jgi:DNA-binding HxlR family transcriptional regulator
VTTKWKLTEKKYKLWFVLKVLKIWILKWITNISKQVKNIKYINSIITEDGKNKKWYNATY